MVIVGVLMLQGPVDIDRLERVIAGRLLALPRFHQRIEPRAAGYWWAPDPFFSVNRHIRRLRLPGRGGKAELQRFVADLASQQLDMAHPYGTSTSSRNAWAERPWSRASIMRSPTVLR
jgi:diacylglycerol O-acyltransferase / wax synthase